MKGHGTFCKMKACLKTLPRHSHITIINHSEQHWTYPAGLEIPVALLWYLLVSQDTEMKSSHLGGDSRKENRYRKEWRPGVAPHCSQSPRCSVTRHLYSGVSCGSPTIHPIGRPPRAFFNFFKPLGYSDAKEDLPSTSVGERVFQFYIECNSISNWGLEEWPPSLSSDAVLCLLPLGARSTWFETNGELETGTM